MKVVTHELDYDMDDDDLRFLQEINEYMQTKCRNGSVRMIGFPLV